MFMHLASGTLKRVQCSANSSSLSDLFTKILIQVLNLLWLDWYLSFTTPLFFHTHILLKKLSDSILELSADEDSTYPSVWQPFPLSPSVSSPSKRLHSYGVKCPSVDSPWPQTAPIVFPISVIVIFLPPSMEPVHHYSVSLSPCHLAAFVMSHEVLSEAPSISVKAQL